MRKSIYIALSASVLFAACSEDMETLTGSVALDVTATTEAFTPLDGTATRASENLYKTEFTNGDQIGITAVKDGKIVDGVNNICFTYNISTAKWTATAGSPVLYNYQDVTYLAYYPYDAAMNDKMTEQAIIDAFTPQTDQSTYANYTKSDLMVATGTADRATKTLTLPFRHTMSLVSVSAVTNKFITSGGYEYTPGEEFPVRNLAETSITVGGQVLKPCSFGDGTFRVIVSSNSTAQTINIKYKWVDLTDYTDQTQQTLTSGKYLHYHFKMPENVPYVRELQAGDFFFNDGRIVPRETLVINDPTNCVGIIYSTDVSRIGTKAKKVLADEKGVTTPHGLVIALTNASEGCYWGAFGTDENNNNSTGGYFYQNTNTLKKQYENVDGYGETRWIIDTYQGSGTILQDTYQAFYHASRYGTADGGTLQYAAPDKTTGWFIPSMGQWWDFVSNLGEINLDEYKALYNASTAISGISQTAVNNINRYFGKISDATLFAISLGDSFWSSSEYNSNNACNVNFETNGKLHLSNREKNFGSFKVRCCFAF